MNLTRARILLFSVAALTALWYTVDEYSSVSNLINPLDAQHN
jgi:hypothetical protein